MLAAPVPQPARPFSVPWGVVLVFAGAGTLLLGFAIYKNISTPQETRPDLSKEVAQLQEQVASSEAQLATLRENNKMPAAELKNRIDANARTAERLAAREIDVKELEEKNGRKISVAQARLDEVQRKEQEQLDAATALVAQRAEKDQQSRELHAALAELQNAVVTIVSSRGGAGTGFFIAGFPDPTIVTTSQVAAPNAELTVNIRYVINGEKVRRAGSGKAHIVHTDTESGLTFLSFEFIGNISFTALNVNKLREPRIGEKVYALGTQVMGDQAFDLNTFDGTISATDRPQGDRHMLQVSLPANKGSSGAPVFGTDKALLGIIFGPLQGLEKAALAIPTPDLLKAIERVPKKRHD